MNALPWYHEGLRFACTGCGDCCTGAPGYVWINQAEIAALAAALRIDVATFEKRYVRQVGIRKSLLERANGDCVFFDHRTRKCGVYAQRPRQCRTFPFWESNLRSPRAWAEMGAHCPGIDRGKRHALEHILKQLGVIRV